MYGHGSRFRASGAGSDGGCTASSHRQLHYEARGGPSRFLPSPWCALSRAAQRGNAAQPLFLSRPLHLPIFDRPHLDDALAEKLAIPKELSRLYFFFAAGQLWDTTSIFKTWNSWSW